MTTPTFPYKPELSKEKAELFARCFAHCLECPDISFDAKQQVMLLQFCTRVGAKSEVEQAIERFNARNPEATIEVKDIPEDDTPESVWPKIREVSAHELTEFVRREGPISGYPWKPRSEHYRRLVQAAQAELARRQNETGKE